MGHAPSPHNALQLPTKPRQFWIHRARHSAQCRCGSHGDRLFKSDHLSPCHCRGATPIAVLSPQPTVHRPCYQGGKTRPAGPSKLLFQPRSDSKWLSGKSSCSPASASPPNFSEKVGRALVRALALPTSSQPFTAGWPPSSADLAFGRSFLLLLFLPNSRSQVQACLPTVLRPCSHPSLLCASLPS